MPLTAASALSSAGVPGLEPRLTGPEPVGLPITPYPIAAAPPEPLAPTQSSRHPAPQPTRARHAVSPPDRVPEPPEARLTGNTSIRARATARRRRGFEGI